MQPNRSPATPSLGGDPDTRWVSRLPSARSALRLAFVAVVLGLGTVAVLRSGEDLRRAASELSPATLVLAELAVLGGLLGGMLSWQALLADLGSPLPLPAAFRVFFLGQLGKYVPGSVWTLVAQMELGKEHGVPRARSGAVGLVALALSLVAGLLLAAATLPFVSAGALERYWWVFLAVPVLGVGLLPAVANPALDRLLRLARRGGLERRLSGRGVLRALTWALLAWACFGVQAWLLADALGAEGPGVLALATGAFSLAWVIGFLVVFAPAGAGVREVALVAGFAPVLGPEPALLLALVSRALMTVGDLLWAGAAVAVSAPARRRAARA